MDKKMQKEKESIEEELSGLMETTLKMENELMLLLNQN